MAWTLGSTRIFVAESKEEAGQIVPRLQPLSGATVLQTFGYESDVRTIGAIVIGNTDKDALKAMRTGGTYELVSPEGSLGTFTVKQVSVQRVHAISQTLLIDGTHACEDPVYQVEIQLYE